MRVFVKKSLHLINSFSRIAVMRSALDGEEQELGRLATKRLRTSWATNVLIFSFSISQTWCRKAHV